MMSGVVEKLDIKMSKIRENLYKAFKYSEVEDILGGISEAIDDIEALQDLLLEFEENTNATMG